MLKMTKTEEIDVPKAVLERDQRIKLLKRAIVSIDKEIQEDKEQKEKKLKVERDKIERMSKKARKTEAPPLIEGAQFQGFE